MDSSIDCTPSNKSAKVDCTSLLEFDERSCDICCFNLSCLNVMKLFLVQGSKQRCKAVCMNLLASQSVIFKMITMISMSPKMIAKRAFIFLSSRAHFSLWSLSSSFLVGMSTSHLLILDWASKINVLEFAAMKFDAAICPRHASIALHCT